MVHLRPDGAAAVGGGDDAAALVDEGDVVVEADALRDRVRVVHDAGAAQQAAVLAQLEGKMLNA